MFLPNNDFAAQLSAQQEYRDGLADAAEPVKTLAENFANRVMPRQSEQMVVQSDEDGVRVVNTDWGAHLDEFGSVNNAPNAPMRRAVREAGLRLEESPKP